MEYTTLPNSDLKVSKVCLGCWQFNAGKQDINWDGQDPKVSHAIVDKCLELGINFFDTAEAYGFHSSERALGDALQGKRRDVIIASKFGACLPNDGKYNAHDIENSLNESLKALQTDYIDLYQVHAPTVVQSMEETVAELKRQQSLGKIRYYAISNFGRLNMEEFTKAGGQAVSNQLPYNLLWRSIEYEIQGLCDQHNIDILAYSPLQQGLLTGKFPTVESVPEGRRRTKHFNANSTSLSRHGEEGAEKETFETIAAIQDICQKRDNMSMTTAAISWLLAQARVASVITGASRPEQMQLNCEIVKLEKNMLSELNVATQELKEKFGDIPDLWAKGSRIS